MWWSACRCSLKVTALVAIQLAFQLWPTRTASYRPDGSRARVKP